MTTALQIAVIFLLVNLVAGLIRIYRGPSVTDRLLAVQLLGTTGIAVLLLLSALEEIPGLIDAALLLALLAAVTVLAFVSRIDTANREAP